MPVRNSWRACVTPLVSKNEPEKSGGFSTRPAGSMRSHRAAAQNGSNMAAPDDVRQQDIAVIGGMSARARFNHQPAPQRDTGRLQPEPGASQG